ncbi:MAG: aminopeptidase P family protein [bacterium]
MSEATAETARTSETADTADAAGCDTGSGRATASHDLQMSDELRASITSGWAQPAQIPHPARRDGAAWTARRRAALSEAFPGTVVVVPAGTLKTRANDTDYPFRADSSFTWLTGETAADAVLVLTPKANGPGHDATLYLLTFVGPGDIGYFTDRAHGAIWVGGVPDVEQTTEVLALSTRPRRDVGGELERWRDHPVAVLRGVDAEVDALVSGSGDGGLGRVLDELRLVKDEWEIARLQHACDATARGFADVARELPMLLERGKGNRGERWLEGTFWRRARLEGNEVGYSSILGAGDHGTTLHWWRDNGDIEAGQLLLADMGVETDELYTADVTRTMPVDGAWTSAQRQVYEAVHEAQQTGMSEVRAGADFLAAHRAAMWVLADHLHSWGILPVTADVSCTPDIEAPGAGLHRRYTLHGTSHMLGIDVHDCARARTEVYSKGTLAAGHVLTVEPGLYFQSHDETVPPELRGLAVRIEDDVLVTDGAPINLSAALPSAPDDVLAWMREAQATAAEL